MFWIGVLVGFLVGGNVGLVCMALFKINKD